jgi:G3E family GTPase
MSRPLVACVGGFLGAGKTTALVAAARELAARGKRVGIVTNDQGSRLVDTEIMRAAGLPAEEVTGGCFCCLFDDLVTSAERILDSARPDVIFAEAVGSCTDLSATVLQPLRRYYADRFDLAPLSVLVEPNRLAEFTSGVPGFPSSVAYLFERQLAEADLIVLTKIDLLAPGERDELVRTLEGFAQGVPVQPISATEGSHVGEWVDRLFGAGTSGAAGERVQEVDYVTYAEAEASLGWLNATVDVAAGRDVSPRDFAELLVVSIRNRSVRLEKAAIAHVKVLVVTEQSSDRIAVTDGTSAPRWSGSVDLAPARELSLIVNARVRSGPEALDRLVREAISAVAADFDSVATVQHIESFSPLPPTPTHRFANSGPGERGIEPEQ